jgi:hypothetical protein
MQIIPFWLIKMEFARVSIPRKEVLIDGWLIDNE